MPGRFVKYRGNMAAFPGISGTGLPEKWSTKVG